MASVSPLASGPVRVVLVDDHEMVIEGLKAMLASFKNRVRVVGEAVGAENALQVIESLQPDIVLCDVRMQGASGLDLCRAIRERNPARKVILLSVYEDEQYLFQALRVGASGYLLKGISSDELVRRLESSPRRLDGHRRRPGRTCRRHRRPSAARRILAGSPAGPQSARK